MPEPTYRLTSRQAGVATPGVEIQRGRTLVPVGVATLDGGSSLGTAVWRVEALIRGDVTEGQGDQWFDLGTSLDLSASVGSVSVPVAGYAAIRVACRTAASDADDLVGVWIGSPV